MNDTEMNDTELLKLLDEAPRTVIRRACVVSDKSRKPTGDILITTALDAIVAHRGLQDRTRPKFVRLVERVSRLTPDDSRLTNDMRRSIVVILESAIDQKLDEDGRLYRLLTEFWLSMGVTPNLRRKIGLGMSRVLPVARAA